MDARRMRADFQSGLSRGRQTPRGAARLSWLALWVALAGCGPDGVRSDVGSGIPEDWPRPEFETMTIRVGGHPVVVEIADTSDKRAYGMMFVSELPDDRGMIFVYPEEVLLDQRAGRRALLSFWMRNTRIPLDLLYLRDDGSIINIHQEMEPLRERPGYPAAEPCRFALELAGGWTRRHGVWLRDRVELPDALLRWPAEGDVPRENIPRIVEPR